MAQSSNSYPNSLPGIVSDQPEIYEYEPVADEAADVNEIDLMSAPTDDAIALIEVPIQQAFSYFASRENEIAKFYVQRFGEYKIRGDNVEEETDIEKYHRLVSEVTDLLNKFSTSQASSTNKKETCLHNTALSNNIEILSRQLKAIEFAAKDGTLDPTQAGFGSIKARIEELTSKVSSSVDDKTIHNEPSKLNEQAKLVRMAALEKRLNHLETAVGDKEDRTQNLLKLTNCENLTAAADTLSTWLSFFKPETFQRVSRELDFLTQRLEKLDDHTSSETNGQIEADAQVKLDQLYNLVSGTDIYRARVPAIMHRLKAMEELQQKSAQVASTVSHLELVQEQIVDSLQANKHELSSLTEMFANNIELIKEFSRDIDARVTSLRDRDQ